MRKSKENKTGHIYVQISIFVKHLFFLKEITSEKNWIMKILINRKDKILIQNAKIKHYFKITRHKSKNI